MILYTLVYHLKYILHANFYSIYCNNWVSILVQKNWSPCYCVYMFGYTKACTMSISTEKLNEIMQICNSWTLKHSCTKSQLQSLLGSLLYIFKYVQSARFHLNRMLALLRASHDQNIIKLTPEIARDLNWFVVFLRTYNGVTYYDTNKAHSTIYLDASLTGLGGCFNQMIYTIPFPLGL